MSAIDPLLAQAKAGKAPAVVVLHGEEFLARKAAEALAHELIPEGQRDFNLLILEAAATPAEVARELSTVGMFRGTKVVWLRDPEFLSPKKGGRADQLARLRELWTQGREKEAVRRVLALAQKSGLDPAVATAAQWDEEAGMTASAEELAFLRDAAAYAREHGLTVASDDGAALESLLERGLPEGHHLIVSARTVDARLGLFKRFKAAGAELSFRPQGREGRDLGALCRELLAPLGKELAPAALARLSALVGNDQVRLLEAELRKVALFVGERTRIEAADVDAVVERSQEIEFLLTNSVEKRELRGAIEGLTQLLGAGAGLPQLTAALGTTLRQLLAAHEATRATGGRLPGFGPGAAAWVAAYAASGLKMGNPNQAKFKAEAAARFSRAELASGLCAVAEADLAVKSGGGRLAIERLLFLLCAR